MGDTAVEFSILPAIKNQATGHYILNGKGEEARPRSFIDLGVEWEYSIEDDIETLHTDGPLHDAVVVLVGGSKQSTARQPGMRPRS